MGRVLSVRPGRRVDHAGSSLWWFSLGHPEIGLARIAAVMRQDVRVDVSKASFILIGLLVVLAFPALAADAAVATPAVSTSVIVFTTEDVVLSTGFRLHADRHEMQGDRVLLYAHDGVTELPASAIDRFEKVEHREQ